MGSPLESRIAALRGRVRRLLALHGLSRVVGAMLLAVVAAGLADYLLNLDAPVRAGLLGTLAVLLGWLAWRFVLPPLFVRFRDLDIALRIEKRWPGLNDRLASTVQFLRSRGQGQDFYLGSAALREAVVEQTLKETESIDFREVVDRRPVARAALFCILALAAGLTILGVSPRSSRIALARLFAPYGGTEWPKQTHLRVVAAAEKVARGEPFTLEVAVAPGDRVPSSGKVTYTYENGDRVTEALRPGEDGTFHGRIEAVTGPFDFAVVAGDDRTAPRHVEVVPPPALQEVNVELVPPAYTGLTRATLASGRTQVRAVEGTRVEVKATANKPIAQAVMYRGDTPAREPVKLDGARLSTAFTMLDSLPFWFALRDRDGFKNQEVTRYEVHTLKDEAPRVVIEDPISDRDVPANADVPLKITLEDDFGLNRSNLLFRIADSGASEATIEKVRGLWSAETKEGEPGVKQHEVNYLWHLEPLKLNPGAVITFYVDAFDNRRLPDFRPPREPNRGKSRELRLRIVSPEQRDQLLNQQRQAIRDEIERVQAMQKSALTPVKEDRRMLERAGDLDKAGREGLRTAAMVQRQVEGRVTNRADGLDRKIQQFLDDLKNFKVDNPDAQKQMEGMKDGVERIREQHLAPSEQGISRAAKALDDAGEPQASQGNAEAKADDSKPEAKGAEAGKAEKGGDPTASKGQQGKPSAASKGQQQQGKAGDPGQQNQGGEQAGAQDSGQQGDQGQQGQQGKQGEQSPQPQAGKASPAAEQAKKALAQAEQHQQATVDELQKMLDGLGEFNTMREMVRDAEKLLRDQDEALKQSAEAAKQPDMAGKKADALSPAQRANLENMGARQGEVAKGLQNLLDKMDDTAKRTDEADPLAASALREGAAQARQQGTAGRMGEAAEQLAKNQMGAARAGQEQARKELKALVDSLKNRRENELARLVRELKKAEEDLQKLRQRQAQNRQATRDARNIQDAARRKAQLEKLAREQQQIRQELERQLKRLEKLNAASAARAGSKAAQKMGQAQQDLDNGEGEQAEQDEEDALADLQEAAEEARQARKEAEEQLALERLSKMEDVLAQLRDRQDKLVEETISYNKARAEHDDKLTPAQRASVRGLSRVQDSIKEETAELVERLEGAPVFALTLKKATESMDVASERLKGLATDDDTQRAEKSASRRFRQLIDALQPLKPKGAQANNQQQGGGQQGGGQQGNGDRIPTSAQVKMLKALQEEVNTRTQELDDIRTRKNGLTDAQKAEVDRLQDEQGSIADLARDITQPKRPDGQED